MDNNEIQLVGGPCGQHGPYSFYKAFTYTKNGVKRIVTLSDFFFVKLWVDSDLLCIGELQLLWIDKNSDQVLSSLRLYFLPENTPEGRMDHGEDEVLTISEKVVLRVEDLVTWITVDAEWTWGRLGKCEEDVKTPIKTEEKDLDESCTAKDAFKLTDPEKEKSNLNGPSVVILSYPRYCRYRAMMKRLEGVENEYLKYKIITALGGFTVTSRNTRILFCRDTFEYPDLEGHEMVCNHLAPKMKGRPRGRRKKRCISPSSESNESGESAVISEATNKHKITTGGGRNGLRCNTLASPRRSTRSTDNSESKVFLKKLYLFMKQNGTPINRIPQLGYKELDLYAFYTRVQKIGGYDYVMTSKLWKSIFDDLTGNHNSTSAATVIRRHYERFLLPFERHVKGEEYKPLPVLERRRLKSKASSVSESENSEGTVQNGTTTPVPQPSCSNSASQTPSVENKDFKNQAKPDGKTSLLRSVRVKPERLRETNQKDKNPPEKSPTPKHKEDELKIPVSLNSNSISSVEKTSEPVTTAIAPVVQKVAPEKSLSPVEAKENTSVIDAEEPSKITSGIEIIPIDVPRKETSPPITKLEDHYKNLSVLVKEVKKQKLDILKEGGLEVTPITSYPSSSSLKETRPSVIQQVAPAIETVTVTPDTYQMPPPPPKRPPSQSNYNSTQVTLSPTQMVPKNQRKSSKPQKSLAYVNGESPPKVLQSKSIYSYSGKTVYGNPKDYYQPSVQHPMRYGSNSVRPAGGDLLDLTVGSPQKPVVEIMRVPAVTSASQVPIKVMENYARSVPSFPLIDGTRIGSNLEITLIGPNNNKTPYSVSNNQYKYSSIASKANSYSSVQKKFSHKRTLKDSLMNNTKFAKVEENGRRSTSQLYRDSRSNGLEISIPTPYMSEANLRPEGANTSTYSKAPATPVQAPNSKQFSNPLPPMFPGYLPMPQVMNKNMQSYLPLLDPIYASALQSMYASTGLAPSTSFLPIPTPEQLQLYQDLIMSRSLSYPFPEGSPSLPTDNSNFKK